MITAAMYRIGVSLFQCHINILITQLPANSYVLIAQMDENIRLFEKKKKISKLFKWHQQIAREGK